MHINDGISTGDIIFGVDSAYLVYKNSNNRPKINHNVFMSIFRYDAKCFSTASFRVDRIVYETVLQSSSDVKKCKLRIECLGSESPNYIVGCFYEEWSNILYLNMDKKFCDSYYEQICMLQF